MNNNRILCNGHILAEEGPIPRGFAVIGDGKIREIGEGDPPEEWQLPRTDLQGDYLSPGFIDAHTHGGGGADFMDGTTDAIRTACRTHLRHGTTTIAPTSLASFDDELFAFFDAYDEVCSIKKGMPHLMGIHLEGPYFSPAQAGAQPPECMTVPFPDHYQSVLDHSHGHIIRWSSAPEVAGVIELGDILAARGILPSIAHTDCDYDTVCRAYRHGYHHLTHFYSAMSTITRHMGYRRLGVVESGYLIDGMDIEIICDGLHLPPELLKMIFKLKDHDHISLVTDSMRAAGMPEGPTVLGSLKHNFQCIAEDGVAKVLDRSCFAGSTATADRMIRVLTGPVGMPVWEAVRFLTINPARLYGLDERTGSIASGKAADLVVFDRDIQVRQVYVDGEAML